MEGQKRSYDLTWRMLPADTSRPLTYNDFSAWAPPVKQRNHGIHCKLDLSDVGVVGAEHAVEMRAAAGDRVMRAQLSGCRAIESRFGGAWSTASAGHPHNLDQSRVDDMTTGFLARPFFPIIDASTGATVSVLFSADMRDAQPRAPPTGADEDKHSTDGDPAAAMAFQRGVAATMSFVQPSGPDGVATLPTWRGPGADSEWFASAVDTDLDAATVSEEGAHLDDDSFAGSVKRYTIENVSVVLCVDLSCPGPSFPPAVACTCWRVGWLGVRNQPVCGLGLRNRMWTMAGRTMRCTMRDAWNRGTSKFDAPWCHRT